MADPAETALIIPLLNGFEALVYESVAGFRIKSFRFPPDSSGQRTTREASITLQIRRFRTLKELVDAAMREPI